MKKKEMEEIKRQFDEACEEWINRRVIFTQKSADNIWNWFESKLKQREEEVLEEVRLIIASYSKIDDMKTKELLDLLRQNTK